MFFVAEPSQLGDVSTSAGCRRVKCRARGARNRARTMARMDWRVRRGERDAPRRWLDRRSGQSSSLDKMQAAEGGCRDFPLNGFAAAKRARA